jgi:hypothetical protein
LHDMMGFAIARRKTRVNALMAQPILRRLSRIYSSVAPMARITLPYFSLSPRMRALNSSGVVK